MNQGFDWWLNGVPVIIPQAPGDFSEWINGAPVVDIGATFTSFTGTGIASASANLGTIVSKSGVGIGIASASATLGAVIGVSGTGTGTAFASGALGAVVSLSVSGVGISAGSALLSAVPPVVVGASRRASPRQPSFRVQDYAAHSFAYRKVRAGQERVRHIGD